MTDNANHLEILDKINKTQGDWILFPDAVKITAMETKAKMYEAYCASQVNSESLTELQERVAWLEYHND